MIELEGVGKSYRRGGMPVQALQDVDLRVEQGEFVAVIGPSGSGKSTLLNIVGCLDRATAGRHTFQGDDVRRLDERRLSELRSRSMGFIFQAFNLVRELTVRENVELPLVYSRVRQGRRQRALNALESVGLADLAEKPASLLSGGEQQRAAIARALINDPDVILADEPTGSIDLDSAETIIRLLDDLHRRAKTILLVTHQPSIAARAGRAVRLIDGTIPMPVRR